jgi:hypothetical protein
LPVGGASSQDRRQDSLKVVGDLLRLLVRVPHHGVAEEGLTDQPSGEEDADDEQAAQTDPLAPVHLAEEVYEIDQAHTTTVAWTPDSLRARCVGGPDVA